MSLSWSNAHKCQKDACQASSKTLLYRVQTLWWVLGTVWQSQPWSLLPSAVPPQRALRMRCMDMSSVPSSQFPAHKTYGSLSGARLIMFLFPKYLIEFAKPSVSCWDLQMLKLTCVCLIDMQSQASCSVHQSTIHWQWCPIRITFAQGIFS